VANLASSNVSFFTIGGGGALTLLGILSSGYNSPVGVAVSNGYAFAPNENSNNVSSYQINTLAVLGSPGTGTYPQGVAVDPLGLYAYVANESTHNVSVYAISPTGTLTSVGSPVLTGGTGPEFLATCQRSGNKCKPPPL
jgi:DNA-binding beta-propeller fold protein YncE